MRVSSRIMAENIKSYLAKQSTALIETQTQIATGKKINSLSDAPGDIGKVLDYRTTLSKIEQYQENITDAKTRVEYTETVLGQINDLVNDAQTIASNPDTENREALALEVANIRDQIAGLVNTKYAGNYLFHGDLTDTAPFDETTGAYDASAGSTGSARFPNTARAPTAIKRTQPFSSSTSLAMGATFWGLYGSSLARKWAA